MGLFGKLTRRRSWASSSVKSVSPPPSFVSTDTLIPQFGASDLPVASGSDLYSPVFVYYTVFRHDGVIPCKDPVDPKNPYLARIDASHIAPPRNVESAILCMCRAEGAVCTSSELFASASDKTPMRKDKHLSIGYGPGSQSLKPLALVIRGISSVGKTVSASLPPPFENSDAADPSSFCKAIVATMPWMESQEHEWLSFQAGDILYTDGTKHSVPWRRQTYIAYRARTADGRVGFIDVFACKFSTD